MLKNQRKNSKIDFCMEKVCSFLYPSESFPEFTSEFLDCSFKRAENLNLEVLNDALSFEIEKNSGRNFSGYGYTYQRSIFSWTVS
jgi:hypothetical protein